MMPPYMSVKVRQTATPGTTCPTLYEEYVSSLTSHGFITCARAYETRPTVYRLYPRRLESLTVCRCYYKGSTFSSVIKDCECWSGRALNLRPPAQQTGAYPIELTGRRKNLSFECAFELCQFNESRYCFGNIFLAKKNGCSIDGKFPNVSLRLCLRPQGELMLTNFRLKIRP